MVNSKQLYNQYKKDKMATVEFFPCATASTTTPFGWQYITDYVTSTNTVSLAPSYPQVCNQVPCAITKGNNPMYVDNDKHIESSKINYLSDRASHVFFHKERPLMEQFHLVDDDAPKTPTEAVERIKAGKYVIDTEKKRFYSWTNGLRWRDPAAVADEAGFNAAWAAFKVAYQDTKDTISIGTPAEGLAAVKALDAWTPTVGTA